MTTAEKIVSVVVVGGTLAISFALLFRDSPVETSKRAASPTRSPAPAAAGPETKRRRTGPDVKASDFPGEWPLTIDAGTLACRTVGPRKYATIRLADGREFALNGSARDPGGYADISPILKRKTEAEPKEIVDRLSLSRRRSIFSATVRCEDAGGDVTACKNALRVREKLSADEFRLIGYEGLSLSWPPLPPAPPVDRSVLIEDALKLCR